MENELLFFSYGSRGLIIKFKKPSVSQIEILSRSFFRDYVVSIFKTDVQDLLLTSDSLTIFFKKPPNKKAIKKNLLNAYDISLSKSIDFKYKHWEIPVCFENNFSSDLLKYFNDDESKTKDYIKRICELELIVQFYGFLPGFCYLIGLPKSMQLKRKAEPTLKVEKGSLAIGGGYAGIYPQSSPGGWHVIGITPIIFFHPKRDPNCFASIGDKFSFKKISIDEYEKASKQNFNKNLPSFNIFNVKD